MIEIEIMAKILEWDFPNPTLIAHHNPNPNPNTVEKLGILLAMLHTVVLVTFCMGLLHIHEHLLHTRPCQTSLHNAD